MIALLLGLALLVPQDGEVRARFTCTPRAVEVGEPFVLSLELDHPVGASVFGLGGGALELDDSWVVLDRRREAPRRSPDDEGRRITRRLWTVASLEPGSRMLADALTVLVNDPAIASVDASRTTVEVAGVLGEDEDAPRPLRGFPEGFGRAPVAAPSPWRWAVLAVALVAWGAVLWTIRRRRRGRRVVAAVEPRPLEVLAALQASSPKDPELMRRRQFELTRLVREGIGRRSAASDCDGLTDIEWMESLGATDILEASLERELRIFFEDAEKVKYAGAVPTSWALAESYGRARRALERVAAPGSDRARAGSSTAAGESR